MTDLVFIDHGSLLLLEPRTIAGTVWVGDNLPDDAMTWCGSIVVEPRYAEAIALGAIADGLTVDVS